MLNSKIWLSYTINKETPLYGGRTENLNIYKTSSIKDGKVANDTKIETTAHIGTHIDMPYHFYEYGQTIDDFDIVVYGNIIANGTEDDMILFSPADSIESWGGLRYYNMPANSDSSIFSYTKFLNADSGADNGGALHVQNFDKISLNNCIFEENQCNAGGGAIFLLNSPINIQNCSFNANLAYGDVTSSGGAMLIVNSSPTISNCIFTDNVAQYYGGAIRAEFDGDLHISHSMFQNNLAELGGGAIAANESAVVLELCYLNGNMTTQDAQYKQGGAAYFSSTDIKCINNLFSNNSSFSAGAIALIECNAEIINNTFSNNNCSGEDAYSSVAIISNSFSSDAEQLFANNIIWNNNSEEIYQISLLGDFADPDFVYNNIQAGMNAIWIEENYSFDGIYENNIDAEPIFTEEEPYPFAITQFSPSLNTGNPDVSNYNLPPQDLAGNSRIFAGEVTRIDQGCYEFQGDNVELEVNSTSNLNEIISIYPNPFNPNTSIKFNLTHNQFVTVEIYNLKGQKIRSLINKMLPPGLHSVTWDGRDEENKSVSSGLYFSKMKTTKSVDIKKVILLK